MAGGQITHGGADMDFRIPARTCWPSCSTISMSSAVQHFEVARGERTHMPEQRFGAFAGYNFHGPTR